MVVVVAAGEVPAVEEAVAVAIPAAAGVAVAAGTPVVGAAMDSAVAVTAVGNTVLVAGGVATGA